MAKVSLYHPRPERWLTWRFSLRTLFVVVTIFCVWLGVQVKWIKDRRDYLTEHPLALVQLSPNEEHIPAPQLLWLFQESGANRLHVYIPVHKRPGHKREYVCYPEAIQARQLFPEAAILVISPSKFDNPGDGTGTLLYTWYPGKMWDYSPPPPKQPPRSNPATNPFAG